ncbi:MAG: DUF58 domain-containing protein [Anaerolineales bacterium]|nr:DUF58 domain-containing protein [Anaerolineales bacterium]MCB8951309.1 DUF58 domain-containing protein [Ardenticatenales bacterium]
MLYLIFLFLAIAILLRIDFVYYIVYVCLGVYAWSRWYPGHALRHLRVARQYNDHAFLGEEINVRLEIENSSRLPLPWLQLTDAIPLGLRKGSQIHTAIALRGRETRQLTYTAQAYRRGYYRLGPTYMQLGDLFGFAQREAHLRASYLTIYPRITPLAQLGLPSRLPFGTLPSRQRLFEDPARPMGVRPFRSGDSLRQVNWKVSASKEALLVKTLEPAISLEAALLLNLNANDYHDRYYGPEWTVEIAASLAAHLVEKRQAVGLISNGADPLRVEGGEQDDPGFDQESGRLLLRTETPTETDWHLGHPLGRAAGLMPTPIHPHAGRAHLMKLLELLARLEADDTVYFPLWIPRACLGLSWGVTILVLTPRGDLETCQALHRLTRSGYNPVLILVERQPSFGQVQERARRLGFTAYEVANQEDFHRW